MYSGNFWSNGDVPDEWEPVLMNQSLGPNPPHPPAVSGRVNSSKGPNLIWSYQELRPTLPPGPPQPRLYLSNGNQPRKNATAFNVSENANTSSSSSTAAAITTCSLLSAIRSRIPELLCFTRPTRECLAVSYNAFETLFDPFLTMDDAPHQLLPALVASVLNCVRDTDFGKQVSALISDRMIGGNTKPFQPCLKMRGLWLLGELVRPEYAPLMNHFFSLHFNIKNLLNNFFRQQIRSTYKSELQAIHNFWLQSAPNKEHAKIMKEMICQHQHSGLKYWDTSSPAVVTTCEQFYQSPESRRRERMPDSALGDLTAAMELAKKLENVVYPSSISAPALRRRDDDGGNASGRMSPPPCSAKKDTKIPVARTVTSTPKSKTNKESLIPPLLPSWEIRNQISLVSSSSTRSLQFHLHQHYALFERNFQTFLTVEDADPSPNLKPLVSSALICARNQQFAQKLADCFRIQMSFTTPGPAHLKMRGLWLLGELLREEYSSFLQELLPRMCIPRLLESFLKKCGDLKNELRWKQELQAIYEFWEVVAPPDIVEQLATICNTTEHLSYVTESYHGTPPLYTCETFYKIPGNVISRCISLHSSSPLPPPPLTRAGNANVDVDEDVRFPESPPPPRVAKASGIGDKNKDEYIRAALSNQLDHLISTPPGPGVPAAVGTILDSLLLYGENQEDTVAELIAQQLVERSEKMDSCDPNKSIRILWVIGARVHDERVKGAIATWNASDLSSMFLAVLTKISEEGRHELREIFRFWKTVMSSIVSDKISRWIAESDEDYSWLTQYIANNNANNKVGVTEFYRAQLLAKDDNTDSDAEKCPETLPVEKDNTLIEPRPGCSADSHVEADPDSSGAVFEDEHHQKVTTGQPRLFKGVPQQGGDDRAVGVGGASFNNKQKRDSIDVPCRGGGAVKRFKRKRKSTDGIIRSSSKDHSGKNSGTSSTMSKLEIFREKVSKDEALVSIGWGSYCNKSSTPGGGVVDSEREFYLKNEFSSNEFVTAIFEASVRSWDIVQDATGAYRVKVVRNSPLPQ